MKPQLIDEYISTGQVKFEYRDFAFIGEESVNAAQAASCALDQGKFWQYHDSIFLNQDGENQGAFSKSVLKSIAEKIGLNMETFNQCLDSGEKAAEITAMADEARQQGIRSTPAVTVNGELVSSPTYEAIKAAIDAALAQ